MKSKKLIKSRSKKFWIVFGVLIFALALVIFVAKTLTDPSQGVIIQPKTKGRSTKTIETSSRIDGKTISFSIPSRFQKATDIPLGPQDVEKFNYLYPSIISQNINISIRKLPTGILTDDSSYNLRKLNPSKYIAESRTINGNQVIIMSNPSEGYSKVAFMTHNGIESNIAITSTDVNSGTALDKVLNQLLGSWQWL